MTQTTSRIDRWMAPLDPWMERVENAVQGLSRRDRVLLAFVVSVVSLVLLLVAVRAASASLAQLQTQVANRQRDLTSATDMQATYQAARSEVARMEQELRAQGDFSLAGFLEQSGVAIAQLTDGGVVDGEFFQEQKSQVAVKALSLQQVVELLYKLQTAPRHLRITDLRVKTNPRTREQLDVNLEVTVYVARPEAPAAAPATPTPASPPPGPAQGDKQG